MNLIDYVENHIERGACKCGKCLDALENPENKQPEGHTADLVFFKVKGINDPNIKEFKELVEKEFPYWLDGKEHSYLQIGGDIGDQGLALITMGLGELLGLWELLTPENMMPFLDDAMKMEMAGRGYISIKTKGEGK